MPRPKRASFPLSQRNDNNDNAATAARKSGASSRRTPPQPDVDRRRSSRLQDVAARQQQQQQQRQQHECDQQQKDVKSIPDSPSPTKKSKKNASPPAATVAQQPDEKKSRIDNNDESAVITIEDDTDDNNDARKSENIQYSMIGASPEIIEMVAFLRKLPIETQRCVNWVAAQHEMGAPELYYTQGPPPYLCDGDANSNGEHHPNESHALQPDENDNNGGDRASETTPQAQHSATQAQQPAANTTPTNSQDTTKATAATTTATVRTNDAAATAVATAEEDDHETMKPPPPARLSPPNAPPARTPAAAKIKVLLACEWLRCTHQCNDYYALCAHLDTVHALAKSATAPAPVDEAFTCHWDLCNASLPTWLELRCHVYQHAYHTHLKAVGEALLATKKLTPCLFDSRRRNALPDAVQPTRTAFVCEWTSCGACFEQQFELGAHWRRHIEFERSQRGPKPRRHAGHKASAAHLLRCGWAECGKLMEHPWRLVDHVRSHVSEKQMACPNCGATFTSYNKFYAHYYRQAEEKPYQCVHCFKQFANEELLNSHMYFHVNCYKCTMCDMTCPSPSALAKHVRQRHMDCRPFKCRECPFQTLFKKDLERHIMTQHEQHVYVCDEYDCDFETTSYYMMRMHDKRVHCGIGPAIYACDCCPERFRRGTQLSEHLIAEHQFQLPSGHSRFTYRTDLDGLFRLQTMRMESLEVTQAIMSPSRSDLKAADLQAAAAKRANVKYEVSEVRAAKKRRLEAVDSDDEVDNNAQHVGSRILSVVVTATGNPNAAADDDAVAAAVMPDAHQRAANKALSMPKLRFSEDDSSMEMTSSDVTGRRKGSRRKAKTAAQRRLAQKERAEPAAVQHFDDPLPQTSSKIKNIQDFSVMKRYLRKENTTDTKIVIELTKVDASGNVLRSETMCAEEFRVE